MIPATVEPLLADIPELWTAVDIKDTSIVPSERSPLHEQLTPEIERHLALLDKIIGPLLSTKEGLLLICLKDSVNGSGYSTVFVHKHVLAR